ncbi:MAG: carboxylesterase family protein [Burkholderiales bacterium]|nr:carboxylesterase family protein [Burkholderiales bacterium]
MEKPPLWIVASVFALASLVFMGHGARAAGPMDALVATQAGPVQGRAEAGLLTFKGIPYAAPPVGDLRWRAPQSAAPWQGTRPALERGPSCIQKPSLSIDSGAGDPRPMGEDCLNLNVWTPRAEPAAKLPVMVWIHGGALIFGAGGLSIYDGAPLAQRGAVVVTINYRMGALGFFAHPSIAGPKPGADVNFGLLDQIAALRWVQQNIAAFGGDPRNVTIFGQSAGAESVLALFTSPRARGLFHKGIAQSPYGIPSHTLTKARATAAKVATALQLKGAQASAAELRAVPAAAFEKLDGNEVSLAPGFIVGDAALRKPILSVFQSGGEAQLPLIIGNTSDDGSIAIEFGMDPAAIVKRLGAARIAVKSLYPKGLSDEQLGRQTVRDLVFTAFARRIAYLHTARAPTWRYYYGYVPSAVRSSKPGVAHGADIPLTMGTLDVCQCMGAPVTEQDREAARRAVTHWFDFAATGTPVPRNAEAWPRDGQRDSTLLEFGETDVVRADFMKARVNAFIGTLKVLGAFTAAR